MVRYLHATLRQIGTLLYIYDLGRSVNCLYNYRSLSKPSKTTYIDLGHVVKLSNSSEPVKRSQPTVALQSFAGTPEGVVQRTQSQLAAGPDGGLWRMA